MPKQNKKIEKLDLGEHLGYREAQIQDKINEIVDFLNKKVGEEKSN